MSDDDPAIRAFLFVTIIVFIIICVIVYIYECVVYYFMTDEERQAARVKKIADLKKQISPLSRWAHINDKWIDTYGEHTSLIYSGKSAQKMIGEIMEQCGNPIIIKQTSDELRARILVEKERICKRFEDRMYRTLLNRNKQIQQQQQQRRKKNMDQIVNDEAERLIEQDRERYHH